MFPLAYGTLFIIPSVMKTHLILATLMACGAGAMFAADGPDQGRFGTESVQGVYLLDEYPGVAKPVAVGGFSLDVDRTHWSIDGPQSPNGNYLGGFRSHTVNVSVSRVPSATGDTMSGEEVLQSYPVATSHGVRGVKVVYGHRENFLMQHISAIRYFFKNKEGQTICFEAAGIAASPNWYRANRLILDNLSFPRA